MRLFLALAVLMLALIAYTEAQEETIEQKFAKATEQLNAMSQDWIDRTKTAFETFQNSEAVVNARNKANEYLEKILNSFSGTTQ